MVDVFIWGAGKSVRQSIKQLGELGFSPTAIFDSDESKWGQEIDQIPVDSTRLMFEKLTDSNSLVYVSPQSLEIKYEMFECLLKSGIDKTRIINYVELSKKRSCRDLQNVMAIVDNLRFCCAYPIPTQYPRIEYNGNKLQNELVDFFKYRNELINKLENGQECACDGCPHISVGVYETVLPYKLKVLNFASYYPCNCNCFYCDYNKLTVTPHNTNIVNNFDFVSFFNALETGNFVDHDTRIIFANGEFTLLKDCDKILERVKNYDISIYTTALIFNKNIARHCSNEGSFINVSVDAGCASVYCAVKGVDGYNTVTENLSRYKQSGTNIELKFIACKKNCTLENMNGFLKLCADINPFNVVLSKVNNEPITDQIKDFLQQLEYLLQNYGFATSRVSFLNM